jgi:hypothetical protein
MSCCTHFAASSHQPRASLPVQILIETHYAGERNFYFGFILYLLHAGDFANCSDEVFIHSMKQDRLEVLIAYPVHIFLYTYLLYKNSTSMIELIVNILYWGGGGFGVEIFNIF